jgi:nitrate reductase NapE component
VRWLIAINAGAAAMLLAALLATAIWPDAAMDLVPHMAVALALHGCGLLAGISVYALRYLRSWTRRAGIRAFRFLAIVACAISAACFAGGLAVVAWGALTLLGTDSDYDTQTHTVPLGGSRS